MNLPVFALFLRSVRVDARSVPVYLVRVIVGIAFIVAVLAAHQSSGVIGAPGLSLFYGLCGINFGLITLGGLSHFATTITEEKEERTLGLLRMTHLNGVAILLGKSSSRLLNALLLLVVQVPFAFLAVTLGGVSLTQIAACYLAFAAYLILLSNLALFCSVICPRSKQASSLVLLFLLFMHVFPAVVNWISLVSGWRADGSGPPAMWVALEPWITDANPVTVFIQVLATGFTGSVVGYQFWVSVCLGAVFFLLAWLCFEPFARQDGDSGRKPWRMPLSDAPHSGRLRVVWHGAPLAWKDYTYVVGGKIGMIGRLVLYGGILWLIGRMSDGEIWRDSDDLGATLMSFSIFVVFFELVWLGARLFHVEIKGGTLSTLLLLPQPLWAIIRGKALGGVIVLIPAAVLFFSGVLLSPENFGEAVEELIDEPMAWALGFFGIFFPTLVAYLTLWLRRAAIAAAAACCFVAIFVSSFLFRGMGDEELGVLFSIGLVTVTVGMLLHVPARLRDLAAR